MTRSPYILIVIVNWNNYHDTRECLLSLLRLDYPNYHILVVDNNSTDNSGVKLQKEFNGIEFIFNNENTGYTGGNNIGMQFALKARADFLLVLNNDIIIENPSILSAFMEVMAQYQHIGILAPMLISYEKRNALLSNDNSLWWKLLAKLYLPRSPTIQNEYGFSNNSVNGSSFLIRTELIKRIGYFNEDFFMYFEEMDYCIRAMKIGYYIFYFNKDYFFRKMENKDNKRIAFQAYYIARNKTLWIKTNLYGMNKAILLSLHFLIETKKVIKYALNARIGASLNILKGLYHGILGRHGKII